MRNLSAGGQNGKIKSKDRYEHIYLIGRTGAGKTSLILNFLRQDSFGDHSIISIDPSGVESEKALGVIDPTRVVKYCSLKTPIGLNPLTHQYRPSVVYDTLIDIIDQAIGIGTGQVKLTVGMRNVLKWELFDELTLKHPTGRRTMGLCVRQY